MAETGAARPGPSPQLRRFMDEGRQLVDSALDTALPAIDQEPASLHRAMRHSVFAGGKRMRPLLTLAAGRACGADDATLLPAACAAELIHTYSLIHDDLPSFDDEALRRGQPTCHVLFGEAVAVLAGDALQALAFERMAAAASDADHPERWVAAIQVLAASVGSIGMCGGQTLDIEAAGSALDLERLRALHRAKTGALITASVLVGGLLAGADEQALARLQTYGDAIGLSFQVVDDLLDVEGSVEALGKRPGGDASRSQPTFPALVGVDGARREARQLCDEAHAAVAPFAERGDLLRDLASYIVDRSR